MKKVAIYQRKSGKCMVIATFAGSFWSRLRGLMFRRTIAHDEALLLAEKRDSKIDTSIHMLFVFTDLAVVWINDAQQVVDVRLAKAWFPAYFPKRPARYVLELNPERLNDFHAGDQLRLEEVWMD
jgi:uncharacterized membrane protein (UPF0127 family)